LPNQVTIDDGGTLNIEAINGSVNVIANGNLGLTTGSSSIDSLLIGATGTVTLGGPAPAAANEPGAGAEPAGGSVAAVPEPATAILLLFGALGLFARRRNVRS
jgi:PEP-CTERM motif